VSRDLCRIACALLVPLAACSAGQPARPIELSGPTMGASWTVKIAPGPQGMSSEERSGIDRTIRDTLTRIESLLSTWDPDSELSRFNRSSGSDPFPVAAETFDVFRWAVTLDEETGGALDVTVAPIVEAWGFGPAAGPTRSGPDPNELAHLLESTGTRHLQLDPGGRWVRKLRPGVRCDFSALAPGYAADRLASMLVERGIGGFLVDVGGELVARGRNAEGEPWQVAIERPADRKRRVAARVLPLQDAAIATSGDYRNYREVNGKRVTHIVDPRTGRPVSHRLASVTVVDSLCVRADALATALMVLGPEQGMELARRLDLAVLFMVRSSTGGFDDRTTPRFDALTRTE